MRYVLTTESNLVVVRKVAWTGERDIYIQIVVDAVVHVMVHVIVAPSCC